VRDWGFDARLSDGGKNQMFLAKEVLDCRVPDRERGGSTP
jgi:hypothetical protein